MHELDNPWEFQFLNQNYHEAPIHNGVMKSKKPDPDRGETNENLWNSEKQISSLLSYLKFLTSESLSFQKKKRQNSTWNKPECEEACTPKEINFSWFWPKGGNHWWSPLQTTNYPKIILALLWDTPGTSCSSDRFNFIWQTNIGISLHFPHTNQAS